MAYLQTLHAKIQDAVDSYDEASLSDAQRDHLSDLRDNASKLEKMIVNHG